MSPAAWIAIVALCSLLLGALVVWLLLRPSRDANRQAAKNVETEIEAERLRLEDEEQGKTGDEVWRTFQEHTDD